MSKNVQRIVTFLLVVLLTCGMFPAVFATDAGTEGTTSKSTIDPLEANPHTDTKETNAMDPLAEADEVTGTHYHRGVIWLTASEKVSYTSQGIEYNVNHMYVHGVAVAGKRYVAYCIDPGIDTNQSSGAYSASASAWTDLDINTQTAVGLTILYGAPNKLASTDKRTMLTYEFATQIIVHEIVLGYRSNLPPFECSDSRLIDTLASTNSSYFRQITATTADYSTISGKYMNKDVLRDAYNTIAENLASHYVLPSFASRYNAAAKTYEMTQQSDGTYAVTLTDTNGVLADCTFQDGNGLTYTVSGNEVTITTDSAFDGTKSCSLQDGTGVSKQVPNLESEAFLLWQSGNYQRMVSLQQPVNDPLPLYFNVSISNPNGTAKIVKKATNGGTVEGWAFEIKDSSGTIIGNYITDDTGVITVGLPDGTYTVTEIAGNKEYWINDATPSQTVTVKAGETVSVTFINQYIGALEIYKALADPNVGSVSGWTFAIYAGEQVTASALTATVVTGDDGMITKYLEPGVYTIMEQIPDESPYYCTSPNPQTVTVTAGSTASVTFTNAMKQSGISVRKVDHTGTVLAGAEFLLEYSVDNGITWSAVSYSATPKIGSCSSKGLTDGRLITGDTGLVAFANLYPGLLYRLTETKAPDGYQMLSEPVYEGTFAADQSLSLDFTVTNIPIFRLPETGSNTLFLSITGISLCCIVFVGVVCLPRKKGV